MCGASPLCTLLWDFHGLGCRLRSPMQWQSHSSAGHDHGGLGEGDWCLLGGWGKGLWCLCEMVSTLGAGTPPPWFWSACWWAFSATFGCLCPLRLSWRRLGSSERPSPTSWSGPSRPGSALEARSGHTLSQLQAQLLYAFFLLSSGEHTWNCYILPQVDFLSNLQCLCIHGLKGSRSRGAQGPSLQPSQLVVLWSAFGTLFSSWRLHCGAGIPAERDPTLVFGWYSSSGVLVLIHSCKANPGGSNQQPSWSSQSFGHILLPILLIWWSCHIGGY